MKRNNQASASRVKKQLIILSLLTGLLVANSAEATTKKSQEIKTSRMVSQNEIKFEKPDYAGIKATISDPKSENYYPTLLGRFQKNDSTLTDQQFRLLYFGYIYQDAYDPYWLPKYVKTLTPYYQKSNVSATDCDTIIKYCKLSIEDFPFDIQQIKMMGYAYYKKGDLANERIWMMKFARLIHTIMSTGKGLDCSQAISVITINHEYELLKQLKLRFTNRATTSDKCDYMKVQPNDKNIEGIYFDISQILENTKRSKVIMNATSAQQSSALKKDSTNSGAQSGNSAEKPFLAPEKITSFPGGQEEMFKFLSQSIRYPREAQKNGVQGMVLVQFVVSKNGNIENAKIIRGVNPSLDAEALRVVSSMPQWIPAQNKGENVAMVMTLPVRFNLR